VKIPCSLSQSGSIDQSLASDPCPYLHRARSRVRGSYPYVLLQWYRVTTSTSKATAPQTPPDRNPGRPTSIPPESTSPSCLSPASDTLLALSASHQDRPFVSELKILGCPLIRDAAPQPSWTGESPAAPGAFDQFPISPVSLDDARLHR
jgi:hypothetical protein